VALRPRLASIRWVRACRRASFFAGRLALARAARDPSGASVRCIEPGMKVEGLGTAVLLLGPARAPLASAEPAKPACESFSRPPRGAPG
jgi:hypothetical protein